ncbi:MAG: glycosyltransferase family 9 protein, partial [Vicinamibacterales bacterium]
MAGDRIVIVAPNWLGDAVMALPAFADIRRHFSGARLTVAARPPVAPLFSMVQGVDDIMTLPGGGGWRAVFGWPQDARALQGKGLDIAILLPNSFATALIVKNAAIPERWGFATDGRGRMLTRTIPKPKGTTHQSEYYRALT